MSESCLAVCAFFCGLWSDPSNHPLSIPLICSVNHIFPFNILLTQLFVSDKLLFNFISFSDTSSQSTAFYITSFLFLVMHFAHPSLLFDCCALTRTTAVTKPSLAGIWETLSASPCSVMSNHSAVGAARHQADESDGYSNWNSFLIKSSHMESFRFLPIHGSQRQSRTAWN